ncbi:MAG: hypothetical protein SFV21_01135, partial [Rhodospirillaceae bacterium]|nr:hypothetical protein [Rhodospirillaceae bacterium]
MNCPPEPSAPGRADWLATAAGPIEPWVANGRGEITSLVAAGRAWPVTLGAARQGASATWLTSLVSALITTPRAEIAEAPGLAAALTRLGLDAAAAAATAIGADTAA